MSLRKYKYYHYLLLLIFLLDISCGSERKRLSDDDERTLISRIDSVAQQNNTESTQAKDKTERIKGRSVIFFMYTHQEIEQYVRLSGEYVRWEITGMFNNFKMNAEAIGRTIKTQGIKTEISTSRFFEIELRNGKIIKFDRKENGQVMGHILTDGINEPKIEFGMYPGRELLKIISDFFAVSKVDYSEIDSLNKIQEKLIKEQNNEKGD